MWLVDTRTLRLRQFFGSKIPEYCILSHTWEDEEITFQELIRSSSRIVNKKGYAKVKETCLRALEHGVKYAWVDTCCIDKTSSAELTESINSMFQWYKNAVHCYVYLSDLHSGTRPQDRLASCRWFTRGWTLQELIAPKNMEFYNQEWEYIGSKKDFSERIASITRIPWDVLQGHLEAQGYSVAMRMSWAANRQTERVEDLAYCLFGIFDVGMPLIYGEGLRAFRRLQEEIIKRSNDLTIFAWDEGKTHSNPSDLFASSPTAFAHSLDFQQYHTQWIDPVFTMTNKGLRFDNYKRLLLIATTNKETQAETAKYSLPIGTRWGEGVPQELAISLQKVGPDLFIRVGNLMDRPNIPQANEVRKLLRATTFHIRIERPLRDAFGLGNLGSSTQFSRDDKITNIFATPDSHWNRESMVFFAPFDQMSTVLAASCRVLIDALTLHLVVIIDYRPAFPAYRIFNGDKHHQHASWLFQNRSSISYKTWEDIESEKPEIIDFTNETIYKIKGSVMKISLSVKSVKHEPIEPAMPSIEIFSLGFEFTKLV